MEPEPRIRVAVEIDLTPDPGSSKAAERRPVVFRRRSRAEIREDMAALEEAYDLLPDDGLDERGLLPVVISEPAAAPVGVPGDVVDATITDDERPDALDEIDRAVAGITDEQVEERLHEVLSRAAEVDADRALYVADTAAARSGVLEDVAVCLRPAEHPSAPEGRRVHCDRAAHHAPATDGDAGGEDGGCLQVSPAGDACIRAAGHAVILQTAHRDLHGNEWDDSGWLTGLPESVRPSDDGELPGNVTPLHGAAFIALRSEFLCGSAR